MRRAVILSLFFGVLFFSGCQLINKNGKNKTSISGTVKHSQSDLRDSLDKFEEYFENTITDASDEIDRLSKSDKPKRKTLKLRSITIKACGVMLDQKEPLTAFVDVWVLSARLSDYFREGYGRKSFEPNQKVVADAFGKIESRIENVALQYLRQEKFEITRKKVRQFAKENPIQDDLKEIILFATETYKGKVSPFEEIITLPLLPLMAVNGVTEGVTGTGKVADSADHIADVVEGFPESARWQLLMLMYDLEKINSVKSALESFSKFSNSSSRLADSAEGLPGKLRAELVELLNEIDQKSENIRKTIDSAGKTSEDVRKTFEAGDKFAKSIEEAFSKIEMATNSWKMAADSTETAVARLIEFSPPEADPFDIHTYRDTVREINTLADKIPELLEHFDKMSKKTYRRFRVLVVLIAAATLGTVLMVFRRHSKVSKSQ